MSIGSDLLQFIRERMPSGASLAEASEFLEVGKDELKSLINSYLDQGILTKTGEKRGTRYQVTETDSSISDMSLDAYLSSTSPLCDVEIIRIETIVKFKEPKNLYEFVSNGRVIKTFKISWDKDKGRNVVVSVTATTHMNHFAIKFDERKPMLIKHNVISGKAETTVFPDYEELREELRVELLHKE